MKGFKNTTRTQYSMGGAAYAKGGSAKGAAKVAKVMGEFKKGELHSGSKEGPKVTKPAQAKAIAMSEARKAGMKAPMKKNEGGKVGKMPPLGESVKSGNRMSKMTAAERLAMEARFGEKKRPSPADSAKSANRIAKEEAAEARHLGVFKQGGKVRKYAEGGPVEPVMNLRPMPVAMPMPDTALGMFDYSSPASSPDMNDNIRNLLRSYDKYAATGKYDMPDLRNFVNDLNSQFTDNDRIAAKSSLLRDLPLAGTSQVTRRTGGSDYFPGEGRPPPMPPMMEQPTPPPRKLSGLALEGLKNASIMKQPPLMMEQPTPPPRKLSGLALEGLKNASIIKEPQPPMPMIGPGGGGNRDFYDRQVSPEQRARNEASMADGSYAAYYQQATGQPLPQPPMPQPQMQPPLMMEQPTPPLQNLGQVLQRIQQKQPPVDRGFIDRMPRMNVPGGPPPAGMAPVDPNKAMMMKHGGRAAMPKGKR
jgi:hypothetical protein